MNGVSIRNPKEGFREGGKYYIPQQGELIEHTITGFLAGRRDTYLMATMYFDAEAEWFNYVLWRLRPQQLYWIAIHEGQLGDLFPWMEHLDD
jgi:hypothetical protein